MILCAYCNERPAIHADHVVPASVVRRQKRMQKPVPEHLQGKVKSCGECNWRKLTRLLIPESWEDRLDELNALGIGIFRVWKGDVKEPAYAGTWK